ncbi:MAG: PDZ domain-containing protein, partial [Tepidisphaeraceae bacterium]
TQDVTVKLGEQPDSDQLAAATNAPARANNVGLMLTTPTDADIQAAGLPDGSQGALVKSVRPNSPAAAVGIQPGDLITKIGDSKVESAEDAKNALSKVDLKKGVRFDLMNRQGEKMVSIRIGR